MEEVVNKVRNNLTSSVKEALDPTTLSQAQPNTGRKSSGPLSANDVFPSTLGIMKEKKKYRSLVIVPAVLWPGGAKVRGCDAAASRTHVEIVNIHIVANSAVFDYFKSLSLS